MSVFWNLDGEKIDCDERFISFYNKFYYNDYPGKIKCVSQSSRFVENSIDDLLKNGITRELDVVHILAWKTGKIKHIDSQKAKRFVYKSDWKDAEKLERNPYYKVEDLDLKQYNDHFEISELTRYICEVCQSFDEWKDIEQTQVILNKMQSKAQKRVGTVYLIALLYFMSKGEYPIYDQYADRAIIAISKGTMPEENIAPDELPSKDSNAFGNMLTNHQSVYMKYKQSISEIFGDYERYKGTRDIDRALWVYGHLFKSHNKGETGRS